MIQKQGFWKISMKFIKFMFGALYKQVYKSQARKHFSDLELR